MANTFRACSRTKDANAPTNDGATNMDSPWTWPDIPFPEQHHWLPIFLSTKYFVPCHIHPHVRKSKCNVFCLKCQGPALCKECVPMGHKDHPKLTLRMVSNKVAALTSELSEWVPDLSLIGMSQSFKANGYDHTFLSPVERHNDSKEACSDSDKCIEYCEENCRVHPNFCSLSCKMEKAGLKSFGRLKVDRRKSGKAIPDSKSMPARHDAKLKLVESSQVCDSKLEVAKAKGSDGSSDEQARRSRRLKLKEVEKRLKSCGAVVTVEKTTSQATIHLPRVRADVDIVYREQVEDHEKKVAECVEDMMVATDESDDEVEGGEASNTPEPWTAMTLTSRLPGYAGVSNPRGT